MHTPAQQAAPLGSQADAAHLAQAMAHIRAMLFLFDSDVLALIDCMRSRLPQITDTEAYLTQAANSIQRSAEIDRIESAQERTRAPSERGELDCYVPTFVNYIGV